MGTPITQVNIQTAVDAWCIDSVDASATYGPINTWDTSAVTDMEYLFFYKTFFNDYIGSWNVSNVTSMSYMFYNATAFNQDIGSWDVASVTSMNGMFRNATDFNQNLTTWDVEHIVTEPPIFKSGANSTWTSNTEYQPKWGVKQIIPVTTVSPICFAKGTIISTDQGNVEIQNIIPGKHTICKKAICHITKTISPEKKIVCVKKNAFGKNKPNKAITMSGNHCIQPEKGSLVKAKDLVLSNPKTKFVDYNQEPLYNVLMEDHNVIKVQNLEVETLDPENIVAKIHNSLMDKSILAKLVKQMNEGIQDNNREKYLIAEYEIKKIN